MENILKIVIVSLVVVSLVFFVVPMFISVPFLPDSLLPDSFIPDSLREETYEEAIEKWSQDRKECEIIEKSGAPTYEYNRCVLEYTQKTLDICEKFPEEKERCDDVKDFIRNNPTTSFLLD